MDFDQLETFISVARLLSFSRAADKRFRTQPAISSQIRLLEEEVGARLLDRSGGKVSLTASGKVFLKFADELLESRKAMLAGIAETERVPRGEIVVGANEGTCLHILPEVFAGAQCPRSLHLRGGPCIQTVNVQVAHGIGVAFADGEDILNGERFVIHLTTRLHRCHHVSPRAI